MVRSTNPTCGVVLTPNTKFVHFSVRIIYHYKGNLEFQLLTIKTFVFTILHIEIHVLTKRKKNKKHCS